MLVQVIETCTVVIDVAGVAIIFGGVGIGLASFVAIPFSRNAGANMIQAIAQLRNKVGTFILFGLEILIASDIARTVV